MKLSLALLAALPLTASLLPAQTTTTAAPTPPPPAPIKLGVGFDYSRGNYGFNQVTEVSSIPVNLSYEPDRWAFRATIPWITIKGPASIATGGTPMPGPSRPTTNTESGLGDILVAATYHARPVPGELNVDFTGRVKLPTADEGKGLGSGLTDFYLQADLYQSFGKLTPFLSAGYRFMGSNTAYPLKDGLYATLGTSYRLTDTVIVGAAYDWREKIIAGAPDGSDAIAFVAVNPDPKWSLLGYMLVGFNDASPDFGIGGAMTYKF